MNQWEFLITQANQVFKNAQPNLALPLYEQALEYALNQFDIEMTNDVHGALARIVVSYLNLADNHMAIFNQDFAIMQYFQCFEFLIGQIKQNDSDDNTEIHALRAYNQLHSEWYSLKKRLHASSLSLPITNVVDTMCSQLISNQPVVIH